MRNGYAGLDCLLFGRGEADSDMVGRFNLAI